MMRQAAQSTENQFEYIDGTKEKTAEKKLGKSCADNELIIIEQ